MSGWVGNGFREMRPRKKKIQQIILARVHCLLAKINPKTQLKLFSACFFYYLLRECYEEKFYEV